MYAGHQGERDVIDLPPQPPQSAIEYRVAAVASPASFAAVAMQYARGVRDRAVSRAQPTEGVYRALEHMPDLDERSPHLDRADRVVFERGPAALAARDPQEGYVSMRLRLSAALDTDSDGIGDGSTMAAAQERARRCMVVRMVSDPRAGLFVVGGEKAMRAARAALPVGSVEACRDTIRNQAVANTVAAAVDSPVAPRAMAKGPIMADGAPAMHLVRSRLQQGR